jgi:hypothetical protein
MGELCALGSQGPGGGIVIFIDTNQKYSDFDYLEVAPTDASTGTVWSTATPHCGITQNADCRVGWLSTSGEAINFWDVGKGRAATAAIVARHEAGGVAKNLYAAGLADGYTTPTATDWFLPSLGEIDLFLGISYTLPGGRYWSSSEEQSFPEPDVRIFWSDYVDQFGGHFSGSGNWSKTYQPCRVRAVRSF